MPKTPSTSSNSAPSRPALRRNQACRSCRRRKLKCDAARPHCGTCVRQWQDLVRVPAPIGYVHPSEPQCSYDPVEGLKLAPEIDPIEKIKDLEAQIAQLRNKLYEHQIAPGSSAAPSNLITLITPPTPLASSSANKRQGSDVGGKYLPLSSLALAGIIAPGNLETQFRSTSGSPDQNSLKPSDAFVDLLFSGWDPDLPDPDTLNHYIDLFFQCDPCGSRILHRPSFLASMHLSPRAPNFPHSSILHAICAAASRWSPRNVVTLSDGTRRDRFAEFHASKTRHYIDKTMEGRWVEVWIFAGFQTRVAVPLRLNYPGTFSTHGNNSPGAYLAPPKDMRDLESRRRTWWMTIMFDRIASVGGWIHAVDERDLGTELPLRTKDFESESPIPSNPQDLSSPDVFTCHPPQYTDSFLLFIKAVMLFGQVTDFNVRGNLRAPTAPSKNQNPFFLSGFEELDKLVSCDFLENLPQLFRHNTGVTDAPEGSALDTDLYMVHIVPHAATITLHNPYIDFADPQNVSAARCVNSARSILSAYYVLSATSLDITRLHPFVTICWYLAAVVQVQLCKFFIEINDFERESTVWGEINVLRFAMMEYGRRSPIGTRQERLLQELMREIVRMTAQKQPLQVGVPLYPFSHKTLFSRDKAPASVLLDESSGSAPLPINPSYDEQELLSH